jgi:hypothetical protein
MSTEPTRRMARLEKHELASLPPHWTNRERGRHLRVLLQRKGIDPGRMYRLEYYPHRQCWLLTQEGAPPGELAAGKVDDESLYLETLNELRRTALTAVTALAAHNRYLAQNGRPYQLPPKPEELTPADLAELLGGAPTGGDAVQFTGEGGWRGD